MASNDTATIEESIFFSGLYVPFWGLNSEVNETLPLVLQPRGPHTVLQ